jgi:CheY-like chemotaxis protein
MENADNNLLLLYIMKSFVILVADDAIVNTKMAERILKNKQAEIISSINQLTEYAEVDTIIIKTFYGLDAGKNTITNIQDGSNQIDLVITDLNMEDDYSGCDLIQEIVKRDSEIPVYVVSNSLSEYFKIPSNTCETLQTTDNNVINIYKKCCLLPNILGVSESKSGKLQIGEIDSLFQKFIEYKKKLVEKKILTSQHDKENDISNDVLPLIERSPQSSLLNKIKSIIKIRKNTPQNSSLLNKIRSIKQTRKIIPQKSASIRKNDSITSQKSASIRKNDSIKSQKSSLLTKIKSIIKTRKITPQKSPELKKIHSIEQARKQYSLNKIIPSAGGNCKRR